MDSSRRAVESYWRSRMIDAATSDEEKVTPVYKLEEICELLRSSNISIVKEISEFILKRLDHKSPVVKQKALRLIKYAVGKSGVEFRREMQRHSVAVRNLSHYKGHVDPLKGDALNKAVRDTAQEAISAIFSAESSKPSLSDDLKRRIQGFGNTSSEIPSDDKKSFLSEVVGLGSSSIKQGLSNFSQSQSLVRNDTGRYRGPDLRRSLEINTHEIYDPIQHQSGSSSNFSINAARGYSPHDAQMDESTNSGSNSKDNSREERLLNTIVTSGGIRLQPTRDAIHIFLTEAARLNPLTLSIALKSKLQSHMWQVRIKAVCILEAILRQKDYEQLLSVASFFRENKDCLGKCAESPQISLREKANKVLHLLDDHQTSSTHHINTSSMAETALEMPDLIDTTGIENCSNEQNLPSSDGLIVELLGDGWNNGAKEKVDDDPFSDVSFHTLENGETVGDLFSGMTLDEKAETPAENIHTSAEKNAEFFTSNDQTGVIPLSFMQYNQLNPSMTVNYSVAGDLVARAPMSGFRDVGVGYEGAVIGHAHGNGGLSSPLPDIFYSSGAMSNANTRVGAPTMSKEETKAFDFISDHVSAARDPKRRAA